MVRTLCAHHDGFSQTALAKKKNFRSSIIGNNFGSKKIFSFPQMLTNVRCATVGVVTSVPTPLELTTAHAERDRPWLLTITRVLVRLYVGVCLSVFLNVLIYVRTSLEKLDLFHSKLEIL